MGGERDVANAPVSAGKEEMGGLSCDTHSVPITDDFFPPLPSKSGRRWGKIRCSRETCLSSKRERERENHRTYLPFFPEGNQSYPKTRGFALAFLSGIAKFFFPSP